MERAISARSCFGRNSRVRLLIAASLSPRNWRMRGHLRRSSASTEEVYANRMNAVGEKEYRRLRAAAYEYEREWMRRAPRTHHEAMLAARELRPLFERL